MRTFWLFLMALPAAAQIAHPRIGCFIDAQQRLRFVYGTAGNFILSGPEREGVLSVLCTADLSIVKTENGIEVNGTLLAAPPGPASIEADGRVCYATGECERFGPHRPPAPVRPLLAGESEEPSRAPQCEPDPGLRRCEPGPGIPPQCQPEPGIPQCQPGGRKIIAHGASRGNAAKSQTAPEGAAEPAGEMLLIAGSRCVRLPPGTERVHYLGPGWLRIVLPGGRHMALSLDRMAVYVLPEVLP